MVTVTVVAALALMVCSLALVAGTVKAGKAARGALRRAPCPLALAVKGGVPLALAVGVVVAIGNLVDCTGARYDCYGLEIAAAAMLAALLTAACLAWLLLFGWALWRAAAVVATDPRAAVFAVFVVGVLALAARAGRGAAAMSARCRWEARPVIASFLTGSTAPSISPACCPRSISGPEAAAPAGPRGACPLSAARGRAAGPPPGAPRRAGRAPRRCRSA